MKLFEIFVIAAALSSCGAPEPKLPNLAAGLPSNFEQAQVLFDERVKTQFPIGTSEAALRTGVASQGFQIISPESQSDFTMAVYERPGFPCLDRWTVRWRAENGKVAEIWGVYGSLCV